MRNELTRRRFGLRLLGSAAGVVSAGRMAEACDVDFSLVIVPDTQYMAFGCGGALANTMQWIVDNRHADQGGVFTTNIKAVIGVGDLADTASAPEYLNGTAAYQKLDQAGIPWINPLGNHDFTGPTTDHLKTGIGYQPGGFFAADQRQTQGAWSDSSAWGGSYDHLNYWVKLDVGSRKLILFAIEFQPRAAVLNWAKTIHDRHPGYECIVSTHSFLDNNGALSIFSGEPGTGTNDNNQAGFSTNQSVSDANANSGWSIWNHYLNRWPRLTLVVCGHQYWEPYDPATSWHFQQVPFASASLARQTVQAVFCNYQQMDLPDAAYAGVPGVPTGVYCGGLGASRNYRIGHLMILQFRPAIGKLEGYALSTNSRLWEMTRANKNAAPFSKPQLLFSVGYTGVPGRVPPGIAASCRVQ